MPIEIDDAQVIIVEIDALLNLSALAAVCDQIARVVPKILELRLAATAEFFAQPRERRLECAACRPIVVGALQQLLDGVQEWLWATDQRGLEGAEQGLCDAQAFLHVHAR